MEVIGPKRLYRSTALLLEADAAAQFKEVLEEVNNLK
jgi:hypothetical protein